MKQLSAIFLLILIFVPLTGLATVNPNADEELAAIQKKIADEGLDWKAGHTSILDSMTLEERHHMLGLKLPPNWKEIWESHLPKDFKAMASSALPATFNWEDSGVVTMVKNQEGCGSCWIFAATGALEAVWNIQRHQYLDLSEQQILSCVSSGWGCDGGWMVDAYQHYLDFGAILETAMPYEANDEVSCTETEAPIVANITDWVSIPQDINSIKTAVLTAPVAVAFTVYDDFYSYFGGCYSNSSPLEEINHAVLIVGWDDNLCNGEGAWRAKNSWGGHFWGDNGYFWIKYNTCNFGYAAALLNIEAMTVMSPNPLPSGDICHDYSYQLAADGGSAPYKWSLQVGSLPSGFTMDESGLIQGQPSQGEVSSFGIRVEDASIPTLTFLKYFELNIATGLNGDADCDGKYNLLDVSYIIKYLYMGGPPPRYSYIADCNCSNSCNLLDVSYLISYLYRGGPAPCKY